jgi:RNA polymerase sigma-70 factor, ECF subfamily
MTILTELEIIEQSKSQDQNAFRELVDLYQGFVYSIAFRMTGVGAEAEDLTQEIFIKVWKNLDRYKAELKFKTWLGKIATNHCLDFLKSSRKKNEMNSIGINEKFQVTDYNQLEQEIDANELHALVMKLAEALTHKQRAAFILRDLEMMDVNEVCEILRMSPGNLKSNLYYARLNIKERLVKYFKLPQL